MALGTAQLAGDYKIADNLTDKVKQVTLKDLNRVFDKYTNAIRWTYLGKKDAISKEDFPQTIKSKGLESPY
jgi:predicted Zn-dependent peptidase